MTKADGTVLVEAVYNYQDATGNSILTITLGGVALTFDMKNEDAPEVSEADAQRLASWAATEDASLVQDTSIALIQYDGQEGYQDTLLNYYAVAMLVDFTPPTALGPRPSRALTHAHHAVSKSALGRQIIRETSTKCVARKLGELNLAKTSSVTALPRNNSIAPQCYGCCGLGCYCLSGRRCGVTRLYTSPCSQHDACIRQRSWYHCMREFTRAAVSVWVCNYGY
jgi:hypothetical protein